MTMSNNIIEQFGDTTLTKVFVGGLAWETPKETMRDHFHKYGEILEAVIISDKVTGRSKGYGFVTFKDPEAARKACEDANPIINGRRANCNLAYLGARARLPKSSSNTTLPHHHQQQQQQGHNFVPRSMSPAPASHVQWYYPAVAGNPASPIFHHQHIQHHHQATVPFYGYSPAYFATDYSYNHQKIGYSGEGAYMGMGGHIPQVYPTGQAIIGDNTLMPMYQHPLNYHHYHQSHTMGLPAHMFPVTTITSVPTIISKPASIVPNNPGTVVTGESFKKVG